VVVQW